MTRIKNIMTVFLIILLYQLPANAQWIQSSVINQGFVSAVTVQDSIIFLGGINLSDSAYSYFYSKDYGDTWTECFNPLAYNPNAIVITDNYIFTGEGFEGGYIFRSEDWGKSWEDCTPNIVGYTALVYCNNYLYAATATDFTTGVYKSSDNGDTWTKIWPGASYKNEALVVSDSLIIVGTSDAGIYGSYDYGNTWTALNSGLPVYPQPRPYPVINDLILFNNKIFAGTKYLEGGVGEIYYTTDLGINWQLLNNALDGYSIDNFTTGHDHLFAIIYNKVCIFQQQTMTWQDITGDLSMEYIQGLAVYGDKLLCFGINGLWYRPISEITGIEQGPDTPREYGLGQNYPNPFNPITRIKYTVPQSGFVTIKVYNILGRQVACLVNEEKPAGEYMVEFNGGHLSSGVYLYTMQAGHFSASRKFILMK